MVHAYGESGLRGELSAAAAILGVPIEVHDGAEWSFDGGTARVGLGPVRHAGLSGDEAAAWVLLLLWESVREVRLAPARRRRRLALSAGRPELEPLLAAVDRLLAAAELLAALPNYRLPLARALLTDAPASPGELLRHLQWVQGIMETVAARWVAGIAAPPYSHASLAPEVQAELSRLDDVGGESSGVLLRALAVTPGLSAMQRFERVFGLLAPPYDRLLALDRAGRGPQTQGQQADDHVEQRAEDTAGFDAGGGNASDEAEAGGDGGEATADEQERARAGDSRETSEGADLFAAEQAGFVSHMLATPLPAAGTWADGEELPDLSAGAAPEDTSARGRDFRESEAGEASAAELEDYRSRTVEHADSIARVREVWRRIVADRIYERRAFTRVPETEGELLDRRSLVRIVADAAAGVERPRGFLRRESKLASNRRSGSTDYVMLIDRSASMQGAPASAAASAALIMLEGLAGVERDIQAEERSLGVDLDIAIRTALIVFDSTPVVVKPLAGSLDDRARRALDAAIHSPRGSTNDAAALHAAREQLGLAGVIPRGSRGSHGRAAAAPGPSPGPGPSPSPGPGPSPSPNPRPSTGAGSGGSRDGFERRRVVILVSDGGTNDAAAAGEEIRRLRHAGVTVFGVGIRTDDLAVRFAPDGMRLDRAEDLPGVLERLVTGAHLTE